MSEWVYSGSSIHCYRDTKEVLYIHTKLPIIAPYICNARYHVNPYVLSTTVLSDT